jgi:hypothetical protein
MDKIPKGDNVLETLVAGLEGKDGGGGQQEDGEEAEHAEAGSDRAVMSAPGDQPFKQRSYLLHRINII